MIDDAAKQLAQLAFTGLNWPYALVQLNGDTHHTPLPTEGHLSVMMDGNAQQCPLRKDMLIGGLQTSGIRIQGCLPRRIQWVSSSSGKTLPESLSNGVTMLKGESTFLQVDLSQSTAKEQELKALSLSGGLSHT